MNLLFFDTETTGLPDYSKHHGDPSQPDIVQLACILTDRTGEDEIARFKTLIKPHPESPWSAEAEAVHGIKRDYALRFGVRANYAAHIFLKLSEGAILVAHNAKFDSFLIQTLLHRECESAANLWHFLQQRICTQHESTPILKLPRKGNKSDFHEAESDSIYKLPKLIEAYRFFTGNELTGAHDAMVDAEACRQVYLGIQRHRLAMKTACNPST